MPFTGQLGTANSKPGNIELGGPVALTPIPLYPRARLEIDFPDNPTVATPTGVFTDVSSRIRSFSSKRGRPTQFDRVEAGTLTVTLENRDGYFNPNVANRLLLRKVRFGGAYDGGQVIPIFSGFIESYQFEYPGTDFDAVCVLTISEGQKIFALQQLPSSYVAEAEGTTQRLTGLLNQTGIAAQNQDVASSTIDNDHALAPVRVIAVDSASQTRACTITNGSATVTLTSGTTDGLVPGMTVTGTGIADGTTILSITDSTHLQMSGNATLSVTVRLTGNPSNTVLVGTTTGISAGMVISAATNTNSQQIFGSGGTNTATVTNVQGDSVTITPPTRDVTFWDGGNPPGSVNTTFTGSGTQTLSFPKTYFQVQGALEHIRQIEATERGLFVVLPNGNYQYQGMNWRPAQTVQATFGEQGTEIPYADTAVLYDDTGVTNEYVLNNPYNGTQVTVSDATSQARYFRRVETIDQIFSVNYFQLPLDQRAFEPIPRLEGLQIAPARDPQRLWPTLLNLDISDKVSVRRRPLGGADFFSAYDQFIESIQHDGSADPQDWRITFVTSPVRT